LFLKKLIRKEIIGFFSVFIVVFSVYLYTIAPTVSLWDCGEFIACSHILGVPHPPGTPFYILLGRLFDILLPFKEVAKRVNFFSVLSGAFAAGFLYLIIIKVFNRFKENRQSQLSVSHRLISIFSSIGAGFCFSVWNGSVEAEVYSISLLVITIGLWLVLKWDDNKGIEGNNNLLVLLVYLMALSVGVHLLPLLLLPGALIFILLVDWKVFKNQKLIATALLLLIIGFSTYLYLMIRAQAGPAINESNPTTWTKLWEVISRKQYGEMDIFPRHTSWETNYGTIRALFEQFKVFFKYFSWQFFPYPREHTNALLSNISIFGTWMYVLIGLWGMFVHFKEDRKSFYLIFILYLLVTAGLVIYLNHEFSPSDPNPAHQPREPRERDYFWSAGFFFFMFYIALALYWMYEQLKKKKTVPVYCVIGFSFILGFIPLVSNIRSQANRRGNWIAHNYAHNLLSCPEENSVFFTNGDNDTFPLWFYQEVKGYRKFDSEKKKGVRVACLALMNTEWYIRQMKEDGIPMDFDSPFRGTYYESVYLREKKTKGIDQGFEDWIIDNLHYMRTDKSKFIMRKEIATRLIIISSQGIKPELSDLTMSRDSFIVKFIKDDFNPSINIYYSNTVSPGNKGWLQDHLKLESLAYRLVGKKGKNMMDVSRFLYLFENELKFNSVSNPNVYKCPSALRIIRNYLSTFYQFGSRLMAEVVPSKKYADLVNYRRSLDKKDIEKLEKSAELFKKAMSISSDPSLLVPLFNELRVIYLVLGNVDNLIPIIDSIYVKESFPERHFFKGQLILDKLVTDKKLSEENKERMAREAEKEFRKVLEASEDEKVINGYIGLLDLYSQTGEKEKREFLMADLISNPGMFSNVFLYNYEYKRDDIISIYMLKKWLEVNPNDRKAKILLDSLSAGH
jgi:hypothetical protein